jgi:hypothetical protein
VLPTQVFKGIWRGTEVAVKKLPYYFEQLEDKEQQKTFLEGFIQETQLMKYRLHPTPPHFQMSFHGPCADPLALFLRPSSELSGTRT